MSLSDSAFARKVEEFKECGQEYRYRDQMMVQYFGVSMAAGAVVFNALVGSPTGTPSPPPSHFTTAVVLAFAAVYFAVLTLHLRNINRDRRNTLNRKEELRKELGFERDHKGVNNPRWMSGPWWIVKLSYCVTLAWTVALVVTVLGIDLNAWTKLVRLSN